MIDSTKSIKVEEKKTAVRDDTLIQLFLPWLLESAENTRNGLFLARKDFRRLCGMRWHLSKTDCRRLLQVLQENGTAKSMNRGIYFVDMGSDYSVYRRCD